MANFNLSLNLVLSNWLSDVTASYPEGFFLLSLSAAFPCTFSGFLAWLGVVCLYLVVAEDVLPGKKSTFGSFGRYFNDRFEQFSGTRPQ